MSDQQSTEDLSTVTVDMLDDCGLIDTGDAITVYISTKGTQTTSTKGGQPISKTRVLTTRQAENLASRCLMSLTNKALSGLTIPQADLPRQGVQACPELDDLIRNANTEAMQNPSEESPASMILGPQLLNRKIDIVDRAGSHSFKTMRAGNDPLARGFLARLPTAPTSADDRCVTLAKLHGSRMKLGGADTSSLLVPSVVQLAGGGYRYVSDKLRQQLHYCLSKRLNGTDERLIHHQRMAAFFGDDAMGPSTADNAMATLEKTIRRSVDQDLTDLRITSESMREAEDYEFGDDRPIEVTSTHLLKPGLTQDNVGDKCRLWAKQEAGGAESTEADADYTNSLAETVINHKLFSEKLRDLSLQDQEEALYKTAVELLRGRLFDISAESSNAGAEISRLDHILTAAETVKLQDLPEGLDKWQAKEFARDEGNYTSEPDLQAATHLKLQGATWLQSRPRPAFVPIRSKDSLRTTDSSHSG